jgi:hypothetical protein
MGVGRWAVMLEECLQSGKARKRAPCGEGEKDREQSDRHEGGEGA